MVRGTMNLLVETVEKLQEQGKTPADVRFVMSHIPAPWGMLGEGQWCTWDEFAARADFEYDDGYGGTEVEPSLKIVGDDWWLERGEYDGSEWWEFKTLPQRPEVHSSEIRLRDE